MGRNLYWYEKIWVNIKEFTFNFNLNEFIKNYIWHICPNCKALIKDHEFVYEQVCEIYYEITGGMMSKHRYYAKDVIELAEKHYKEYFSEKEDVNDILEKYRNHTNDALY